MGKRLLYKYKIILHIHSTLCSSSYFDVELLLLNKFAKNPPLDLFSSFLSTTLEALCFGLGLYIQLVISVGSTHTYMFFCTSRSVKLLITSSTP